MIAKRVHVEQDGFWAQVEFTREGKDWVFAWVKISDETIPVKLVRELVVAVLDDFGVK